MLFLLALPAVAGAVSSFCATARESKRQSRPNFVRGWAEGKVIADHVPGGYVVGAEATEMFRDLRVTPNEAAALRGDPSNPDFVRAVAVATARAKRGE